MVAESRRFSQGDKQQEATYLHFQRPAPAASPPPRTARVVRVYPGSLRFGGGGGTLGKACSAFPAPKPHFIL